MEIKNRNSLWRSGLSVINQFSILTSHFPILNSQFSLLTMPHANHVRWRLRGSLPVQVDLSLPHNLIHLQAVDDAGGGITVQVTAQSPFTLEIETEFVTYLEQVPAGHTRYLLTYLDRTDIRRV